jgi:hypothetical protein
MPMSPIAKLEYDVAIMECAASTNVYRAAGCRLGQVIIKNRARDYTRMDMNCLLNGPLTIGIFLSKDPVVERLAHLVGHLLNNHRIAHILVRPHPANQWRGLTDWLASHRDARLQASRGEPITSDLQRCHILIAGNSTVHIDAVVAGTPACYMRGLDHAPDDVQSFVRNQLVCELDLTVPFTPDKIYEFYSRGEWPAILRRYADIDHDEADFTNVVASTMHYITSINGH